MPVGPWGFCFLFLVAAFLPYLAIKSYFKLKAGLPFPSRGKFFAQVYILQIILLLFSVFVARGHGIEMFPRTAPAAEHVLTGLAFLAAAAGTTRARWKSTPEERRRRVYQLVPQSRREEAFWLLLCVLVGISEEITYRGVLYGLVLLLTGNTALAVILCSVVFAASHAVQGWKSCVVVFFFAAGAHLLVLFSGSLYVAMAVHAVYDILAGIIYGRLGRAEFGPSAPAPSPTPAQM